MEDVKPEVTEPDDPALGELDGRDRRRDLERGPKRLRLRQPLTVRRVDGDRRTGVLGDRRVVADVVPVAVRRDDQLQRPATGLELAADPGQRGNRGIDRDRLS